MKKVSLISLISAGSFVLFSVVVAANLSARAQQTNKPGTTSSTVSSDAVNEPYADETFPTLPESELQPRMPIDSVEPAGDLAPDQTTPEAGHEPGAVDSSFESKRNRPASFGTSQVPYSTSRVLVLDENGPYRPTGKLYMAFGGDVYNTVCSASMIGKSLLVTAAHCIHDFGQGSAGWARKVKYVPAKWDALEPFSSFESTQFLIPTAYYNGTDTCTQTGVVCNNDIALIALSDNSRGQQAGNLTGYYGYGWNGYSFATPSSAYQNVFGNKLFGGITQLGYPGSHDSGLKMQINTAYGAYYATGNLKNTWLGSAMTGGSSGGPWLVNFGISAVGANYGSADARNIVVGVTSYGNSEQRQGASWFGQNVEFPDPAYGNRGAGNIGKLVYDACDNPSFSNWILQSKGRCR